MSDRFVSGGTINGSNGEATGPAGPEGEGQGEREGQVSSSRAGLKNTAQWEAVERELEGERRRREEQRRKAVEGEEKSLYEILQDNKAAKQAAFEEQAKLKNQFRALDDDEIEFLDEVRQKKRMEEEAARRETEEGLRAFRAAQKGPGPERQDETPAETESWGVGRKRKRLKEREIKGLKKKVGVAEAGKEEGGKGGQDHTHDRDAVVSKGKPKEDDEGTRPAASSAPLAKQDKPSLGLVGYGSDSDDE